MPDNYIATIRYHPDYHLFWIRYQGDLRYDDWQAQQPRFAAHPDYVPQVHAIHDFTDASLGNISAAEIDQSIYYIKDQPHRHGARTAYVSASPLDFGILRMFVSRAEAHTEQERMVFRQLGDALTWLRPDASAELLINGCR